MSKFNPLFGWVYDVETYPNFFLAGFRNVETGEVRQFEISERINQADDLCTFIADRAPITLFGYNSHGYDDHLLHHILVSGGDNASLYAQNNLTPTATNQYPANPFEGTPDIISIDLQKLMGYRGSLKDLAIKLNWPKLQELPIAPGTVLSYEQMDAITTYNVNDLDVTEALRKTFEDDVKMRVLMYQELDPLGADHKLFAQMISAGDTQLGQTFMERRFEARGLKTDKAFKWMAKHKWSTTGAMLRDPRVTFDSLKLQALLADVDLWDITYRSHWASKNHRMQAVWENKPKFTEALTFNDTTYTMAMGGLHSQDTPIMVEADEITTYIDVDIVSYYPNLISNLNLLPKHIDQQAFAEEYRELIDKRVEYVKKGDKLRATAMKLVVNSLYGKSGFLNSWLCDPLVMAGTTINGQLILLMLVERAAKIEGLSVFSANTDGLMFKCPRGREEDLKATVEAFAAVFGFEFKWTRYKKIARFAINDYVAMTDDGEIKAKGAFLEANWPRGKCDMRITKRAAVNFLMYGTPIEETVRASTDLNDFVIWFSAQKKKYVVKDQHGNVLPNINRWVIVNQDGLDLKKFSLKTGQEDFTIEAEDDGDTDSTLAVEPKKIEKGGDSIINARSVLLVNDMPDTFPDSLDYSWYIREAQKLVRWVLEPPPAKKTGHTRKNKYHKFLTDAEVQKHQELRSDETVDIPKVKALVNIPALRETYETIVSANANTTMMMVLRTAWTQSEGQMTKGELLWVARQIDAGKSYFEANAEKRERLAGFCDSIVGMVPFERPVMPEDDRVAIKPVKVYAGHCGNGKSHRIEKDILAGGVGKVYWWAVDKINPIVEERRQELEDMAKALGLDLVLDVEACHSEQKKGRVADRLYRRQEWINDDKDRANKIYVTLFTHATLCAADLTGLTGTLIIDEPLQIWDQFTMTIKDRMITNLQFFKPMEASAYYDDQFNPTIKGKTQVLRYGLTQAGLEFAEGDNKGDWNSGHLWELCNYLKMTGGRLYALEGHHNAVVNGESTTIDMMKILHPNMVKHFDDVIVAAAEFDKLMMKKIWEDVFGVQWDIHEVYRERKKSINDRSTVYYIREKMVSDNFYSKNPKKLQAMANAVRAKLGDTPYIWAANEKYHDQFKLAEKVVNAHGETVTAKLTPKANGINMYKNVDAVVWLATMKVTESAASILSHVWGHDEARAIIAENIELYAAYQFVCRGAIRDFDCERDYTIVVADKVQAEYLAQIMGIERVMPIGVDVDLDAELEADIEEGDNVGGRPATVGLKDMSPEDLRKRRAEQQRERRKNMAGVEKKKAA